MSPTKRMTDNSGDAILWEAFLAGNDEAYVSLYRSYAGVLFSYGMRFTRERELVKDCLHDIFVRLYARRSVPRRVRSIKAYLMTVMRNELYANFRKHKESVEIAPGEEFFRIDYTAEEALMEDECDLERQKIMRRVLDMLTSRQKEVFYYRYLHGMELDDICEIMDMNYQSLQNLIQRSIHRVRERWEREEECCKSDRDRESVRAKIF